MKITMIEIEATAEDLRSNRTISDCLCDAMARVLENVRSCNEAEEAETENEEKAQE